MTSKDENHPLKRQRIDPEESRVVRIPYVGVMDSHDLVKLSKAAEAGNADAQYNMGLLYSCGHYLQRNDYDAVVYYLRASQQGHLAAIHKCSEFYMTGNAGLPCRPPFAIQGFRYAAERGYAASQRQLGLLYFSDQHLPKSVEQGIQWLQRASHQGDEIARVSLCIHQPEYYSLDQVASTLITPEGFYAIGHLDCEYADYELYIQFLRDHEKDKKRCEEWIAKAAHMGHCPAMLNLFHSLRSMGRCLDALEWLTRGIEKGDPACQSQLGLLYSKGELDLKRDTLSSVLWHSRAAHQGYRRSTFALARHYYYGTGVSMDRHKAHGLFSMAAYQGSRHAMRDLSYMYRLGEGCEVNQAKSLHWLVRAACAGDKVAQKQLYNINREFRGVLHDIKESYDW